MLAWPFHLCVSPTCQVFVIGYLGNKHSLPKVDAEWDGFMNVAVGKPTEPVQIKQPEARLGLIKAMGHHTYKWLRYQGTCVWDAVFFRKEWCPSQIYIFKTSWDNLIKCSSLFTRHCGSKWIWVTQQDITSMFHFCRAQRLRFKISPEEIMVGNLWYLVFTVDLSNCIMPS